MSAGSRIAVVVVVAAGLGSMLRPAAVEAGSAPAEITCTAEGTGETLSGIIPRDSYEIELTLDDGKGHAHTWKDEERLTMVDAIDDQVLMMHVAETPELYLWAIPKTIRIESKRHEAHGRFGAKARVLGFAGDTAPRVLALSCRYDYAI